MPDRGDANLFKILVGQVTQNFEINIILGKALSVLPETELSKPVRNLLHRRPSTDLTLPVLDRHVVGVYQPSPRSSTSGARRRARHRKRNRHVRLIPKSDMCSAVADVRYGPIADMPFYSMTSSARVSRVGGTQRPGALTALRLITSSYLVGACTGRSTGFSPLSMRPIYPAASR